MNETEMTIIHAELKAERDALKAECDRLRAALKAAGESMMYFDVGKRTEAYLAVVKAMEYRA